MTQTAINRSFSPMKKILPKFLWRFFRSVGTAVLTPLMFSYGSGHFLSSFREAAVTKDGAPLPWYTYPCIDFLRCRSFSGKRVLEFGGGQSTLWWASRCESVVTFEGDRDWYEKIKNHMPSNVSLTYIEMNGADDACLNIISALNEGEVDKFDVVIIDGLYRKELVPVAMSFVKDSGVIVCDNAEGYGFYDSFVGQAFLRVDFYGYAPGVYHQHATSLYFKEGCEFFSNQIHILRPAVDFI